MCRGGGGIMDTLSGSCTVDNWDSLVDIPVGVDIVSDICPVASPLKPLPSLTTLRVTDYTSVLFPR